MSAEAVATSRPVLSNWCGWALIGGLALVPVVGWLAPMGYAVLFGLVGLLCLPAIRIEDEDRPVAVLLLVGLIWAAISTAWSPYHPSKAGNNTALKLAVELPLYWAVVCGARRADPRLQQRALLMLAWSYAALGLLLLMEFAADARIMEALHVRFLGPIRHDIAQVHIGHSSFVLALLWPLGLAAALRAGLKPWIALPMVAGTLAAGLRFGSDAPVLSMLLASGVGLSTWRWPAVAPKVVGAVAVVYWLAAPLLVWGLRAGGDYAAIQHAIPLSWAERMGYWSHAVDWIRDHPLRGWGLDASRMFGPGIVLHPHDDALQIWLELGGLGAVLAAALWWRILSRLARPDRDPAAAAVTASASVYLLFGALNFGVWQEWWLALGALLAAAAALLSAPASMRAST